MESETRRNVAPKIVKKKFCRFLFDFFYAVNLSFHIMDVLQANDVNDSGLKAIGYDDDNFFRLTLKIVKKKFNNTVSGQNAFTFVNRISFRKPFGKE